MYGIGCCKNGYTTAEHWCISSTAVCGAHSYSSQNAWASISRANVCFPFVPRSLVAVKKKISFDRHYKLSRINIDIDRLTVYLQQSATAATITSLTRNHRRNTTMITKAPRLRRCQTVGRSKLHLRPAKLVTRKSMLQVVFIVQPVNQQRRAILMGGHNANGESQ